MNIEKARILLKNIFGYDSFLPLQEDVIRHILSGKDTLVIMPTGGGKSLCYQLPALMFKGLTLVISPLISLMKDQVEQLHALGIQAVFLNSSLSPAEYQQNMDRIKRGEIKLLYLAPEALLTDRMLAFLKEIPVDCMTIDEAHCISEWGHDFRPEYRQLIAARKQFPGAVCIALTATATERVRKDIKACLEFKESDTFLASFNRENLFLQIIPKTDPYFQITDFLKDRKDQSGIIYCFSRRQVDELCMDLEEDGYSVKPYHAGLEDHIRKKNQDLFIKDDVRIMVATIAFGMGINKPNVRFVIHHDLPKNIESYYQQIGRAGRDGLSSHCLLLFSYGDLQKINYFIQKMEDPKEQRMARFHLDALVRFAESNQCRRYPLLTYFGETPETARCNMCDNCISEDKTLIDLTQPAQMFLSCVKRMDEKFGVIHTIDVLRGSRSQKVLKFNHDKLSTHGIGVDYSKEEWLHFSRQLINQELLAQDMEIGSLHVTPKGWEVLQGKAVVMGTRAPVSTDYSKIREDKENYDTELFNILRTKRKELADMENLPPYVIFSDKTLTQMAAVYPQQEHEMLQIHGIGHIKFKKYGAIFMHIIHQYCRSHGIAYKGRSHHHSKSGMRPSEKTKRFYEVGQKYNEGQSITNLMIEYHVQQNTILNHLYRFHQTGQTLRKDEHLLDNLNLSPEIRNRVFSLFDSLGVYALQPVYSALNDKISYEELHLLRIDYLTRSAASDSKDKQ